LVFGGDETRLTSPTITGDELELFYVVGPGDDEHPYVARRQSTQDTFEPGSLVVELDVCTNSVNLDVSQDGLRMYLACTDDLSADGDLLLFERSTRSDAFALSGAIGRAGLSVSLSDDELTLFYAPRVVGGMRRATRASRADDFSAPAPVSEFSSLAFYAPDLASDDLSLYGATEDEIAVSTLSASSGQFSAPIVIVDDSETSGAPAITQDCRKMYYIGISTSTVPAIWGIYRRVR
jgi:hypothetical protein